MAELETLGKYEIRRTVGRGAAGTVLEGWDPIIQRRVAIKTVRLDGADDPDAQEQINRFRREAQAAGQLVHPNIVTIHDYGETGDLAYIVMEYVEGPSLKTVLDLGHTPRREDIVRVMEDVLSGLSFSHQHGIIHRDIKPGNIMLTSENLATARAKIADFGIARVESSTLTQAGTMMGTPAYMAPEQFLGETIDARSDIYAAGVLLFQLLTGQRPFEGSISSIMHQVLTNEPRPPSTMVMTVDPALDPVVLKAIAKRPAARFQHAAAFAEALREAMAQVSEEAGPPDQTIHAATPPRAEAPPARPATTPAAPPVASPAVAARAMPPPPAASSSGGSRLSLVIASLGLAGALGLGAWLFLSEGRLTRSGEFTQATVTPPPSPAAPPAPPSARPSPPAPTGSAGVSPPVGAAPAPAPVAPPAVAPPVAAPPPAPTQVPPVAAAPVVPPVAPPIATPAPTPAPPVPLPAPATASGSAPVPAAPPITGGAAVSPPVAAPPAPVTPPVAIAPPPITPVEPVTAFSAASRGELARLVNGVRCAILDGGVGPAGATLRGVALTGVEAQLRRALAEQGVQGRLDWQAAQTDPVFCPVLDTLRPIRPAFDSDAPRLRLTLADDRTVLKEGQAIRPRVIMPPFAAYLYVGYVAHDGNVQHLYPQVADARQGIKADPVRLFAPSEWVNLGDPGPGQRGWEASEPFGRDMIISVASARPLFATPRPANAEAADAYLRALERAIETLRQAGVQATAAAVPIEVTPR